MQLLDWIAVVASFVLMVAIGVWSYRRVHSSADFFAAGGRMPWWMSGVSHHMSGYSAVMFTAYAGVAYSVGISFPIWIMVIVGGTVFLGAIFIAPRFARLRMRYGIQSPMEYLRTRYDLPTQQIMVWGGGLLKVLDIGSKYAAGAVFLNVVVDLPFAFGVVIAGVVTLIYITVGGIWADALNDFLQFVIQMVGAIVLCVVVIAKIGGLGALATVWDRLPAGHTDLFTSDYPPIWAIVFSGAVFLSYNGGTWNLAQRYIAAPRGTDARKAAGLSAGLNFVLPLAVFLPSVLAPLFYPDVEDPAGIYAQMAMDWLPPGLLGLIVAAMFAAMLSMTGSDLSAVSAVLSKDVLPLFRRARESSQVTLRTARIVTFTLAVCTVIVAVNINFFGGIVDLILVWFFGLLGPIAIPMILGLLPPFRRSGPWAAIASVTAGFATFAVANFVFQGPYAATTGMPLLVSFVIYAGGGLLDRRPVPAAVDTMLEAISADTQPPGTSTVEVSDTEGTTR